MFQIHHILPQSLAGHFTLKVLGNRFNLHGIKNLIDLPSSQEAARELGSSPHTGGHLASYNKMFCKFLEGLQSHPSFAAAEEGDTAAVDQLDAEMSSFLAAAKHALARGHLLTNTPSGMTPEGANRQIDDWHANWKTYAEENRDSIRQMQDTVDQLHAASQWRGALRAPILLPDGTLSLADKLAIIRRYSREGRTDSPISQHFEAVEPVPDRPGLIPPVIDTRVPPFIPPLPEDLNRPEGLTPGPPQTYGLPGLRAADPRGFGALPPTTVPPQDPLVLRFDPASGAPLPFFERSPILDPDPPSAATPPNALYGVAAVAALGVVAPQLLPLLGMLGAMGLAGTVPARASGAESGAGITGKGVFSTGTTPYDPFAPSNPAPRAGGSSLGLAPGWLVEDNSPKPEHASTFVDRFGNWASTPSGTMPAEHLPQVAPTPAAGSVAPEDVRRLARVNESNAGSVFTSGSAPIPYLPSTEFNERFGSWTVPTAAARQSQPGSPIGAFADEPSYLIPPPIFGVDGPGNPRKDAEKWFSRWIRPLLPPE